MLRARQSLDKLKGENPDQDQGIQIASQAMQEPLRQIVTNAGDEGSVILAKVEDGKDSFGYNAATSEFGDMLKMDSAPCIRFLFKTPSIDEGQSRCLLVSQNLSNTACDLGHISFHP